MTLDKQSILYSETDGIGLIILNRPDRLNTFRRTDYENLLNIIRSVKTPAVRALVLTARGRAFSAGQDLAEISAGQLPGEDEQDEMLAIMQDITRTLAGLPIPTLTAFNGFAVGAGLEMALACDFRIATPQSYFMFAEVRRGLFPTNGVLWLLPRLVGLAHARDMLLTGRRIDAAHALGTGLINQIIGEEDLQSHALGFAGELADNAHDTICGIKALLHQTYDLSLEEMMRREIDYNRASAASEDFAEGVSAFLEKRTPDFRRRSP